MDNLVFKKEYIFGKKPLIVFVVLSSTFAAYFSYNVYSMSSMWSWAENEPVVTNVRNQLSPGSWIDECRAKFRDSKHVVDIQSQDDSVIVKSNCIIGTNDKMNAKLLSYNQGIAIQFNDEKKAYVVSGIECEISCVYLPSKDTFIVVKSNNSVGTGSMYFYKDFIKKINKEKFESSGYVYYSFSQDSPDMTFGGVQSGLIKYIQRSSNDKWLIAGMIDLGLVRINLETNEVLKFSDWQPRPGSALEFDLTNDGSRVVVSGLNSPNTLFEIKEGCGRKEGFSATENELIQPISNPCGSAEILQYRDKFLASTRSLHQPRLDGNGGELSFYAVGNDYVSIFAVMRAAGYHEGGVSYLALGDSYSSGEGDTERKADGSKYYRPGTDVEKSEMHPREKCHLSTRSYPYILSNGMSLGSPINSPLTKWQSVACSGATMWDMKGQAYSAYEGQGGRLLGYNQTTLKDVALNEFIPGRQKQIEFVRQYRPKAVTLTAGGNDIGFGEKMKVCALNVGTCDVATQDGAPRFAKQIKDQYSQLKSLYEEIFNASGRTSKIYVVGYPQFINGGNDSKCEPNTGLINAEERVAITKAVSYLNNIIEQASKAAGVKFIDIEDSLNGHKLCDDGKKYVTGVSFVGSSELVESYHPNSKGQYEMAMAIWGRVSNQSLVEYKWCDEDDRNCPLESATKDSIQSVDSYPVSSDPKTILYKQMANSEIAKGDVINIKLPPYSMLPGSLPVIKLKDSGVNLASPVVQEDGSLSASAVIPSATTLGPQTIEVEGDSYSEEPLIVEQIVTVVNSDASDLDGDGIVNAVDPCMFVLSSAKDIDKDGVDDACDSEIGDAPIAQSPSPSPSPSATPSPSPSPSSSPPPGSGGQQTSPLATLALLVKKIVVAIVKVILKTVSLFFR